MTKYVLGSIGLAVFAVGALLGQTSAFGEESGCCPAPGCGQGGCQPFSACCPRCGCRLEPVCQVTCGTKKETIHKYGCVCKYICLPPVTPLLGRCEPCDSGNHSCSDCGHCKVRAVNKLVICPVTKETTTKECAVKWTCPKCGCGYESNSAAPSVPAGPSSPAPAPAPQRLPPPPRVTDAAPSQPEVVSRGMPQF
jgi:hypothetical protein